MITRASALLLGTEPRVVIPIARSLARLGVHVVIGLRIRRPILASRALHETVTLPNAATEQRIFQTKLVELLQRRRIDVVIPVSDASLAAVSEIREELRERTIVACPSAEAVRRVLNKELTLETASVCGVPCPQLHEAPGPDQSAGWLETIEYPVVVKARAKTTPLPMSWRHYANADLLSREFAADPRFGEKYIIQEYVTGDGVGLEAVYEPGAETHWFQHRRLQECGVVGGGSVLAVAEEPEPELVGHAERLLGALGWVGPAMVEFRHDRSRNACWLMEVNGRYWGSLGLSFAAGLDFPADHWRMLTGQPRRSPITYRRDVMARWTSGCIERAVGKPRPAEPLTDLTRAFRPGVADMLWSWRDPAPAVVDLARTIVRIAVHRLSRYFPSLRRTAGLSWREKFVFGRRYWARILGLHAKEPTPGLEGVNSVLILCHGNIMRSPVAGQLLVRYARDAGLSGVSVTSGGLYATDGKPAEPQAVEIASSLGVSLAGHRARLVTSKEMADADLILAMDFRNEACVLARAPSAAGKLVLLGSFLEDNNRLEIADPYGKTGPAALRSFEQIDHALRAFTKAWAAQRST